MSRIKTAYSCVELICLLPNEWKDHPEGVTKMILSSEFQYHLQEHNTTEGLVVCIDGVTAESRNHFHTVWFRKQEEEIEPDLIKYYPLKIKIHQTVKISRV